MSERSTQQSPDTVDLSGCVAWGSLLSGGLGLAVTAAMLWLAFASWNPNGPPWFDAGKDTQELLDTSGFIVAICGLLCVSLIPSNHADSGARSTARRSRPAEPWTWREDWRAGVVTEAHAAAGPLLVYAIACLLGTAPSLDAWTSRGASYPAVLSTVVGLCAAAISGWIGVRSLVRQSRFQPRLHLASPTGVVGGPLEAAVELGPSAAGEVAVRLVCEETRLVVQKRAGGEVDTRDETNVTHDQTRRAAVGGRGLAAVRFAIPQDVRPTSTDETLPNDTDGPPRVDWALEVTTADGRRVGRFEVPVFVTAESRADFALPDTAGESLIRDDTTAAALAREGVLLTRQGASLRYESGRGRRPGAAVASVLITLCLAALLGGLPAWGAAVLWDIAARAGGVTRIAAGAAAAVVGLFAAVVLSLFAWAIFKDVLRLFVRRVATVDRDFVRLERTLFVRSSAEHSWDALGDVDFGGGSSAGRFSSRDLVAKPSTRGGPSVVLADAVTTETGRLMIEQLTALRRGEAIPE